MIADLQVFDCNFAMGRADPSAAEKTRHLAGREEERINRGGDGLTSRINELEARRAGRAGEVAPECGV